MKLEEKKEKVAKKMKQFKHSLKRENISYGELAEMQHPKYRKHLMKDAGMAEAAGIPESEFRKYQK